MISNIEHDVHGKQEFAYKMIKNLNSTVKDVAQLKVINHNEWIEHYTNLWNNQETNEQVMSISDDMDEINFTVDAITIEELREALKKMKNRKAAGPDGITTELLKHGGPLLEFRLLHLLNECWQKKKIPTEWQTAEVISIFKKGDRSKCSNYRGISLLSTAYKIYSKIINERLKLIAEVLLEEEQSGFRKGRSCSDNIFILKRLIEKRREFNLETHIAFVDFERAFDCVNRQKLQEIMKERGFPNHLIEITKSLYKNTNIIINNGGTRTNKIKTNQGLRQGCGLSPTLFNIYIDDVVKLWKPQINPGIKLREGTNLNSLIYADDLTIIQNNEDDLQRSIYRLKILCEDYNLKISKDKTKIMAFEGKETVRSKIIIDNKTLEQVSHFNYLGCDTTYERDKDVESKVHKFQAICGTINRTLKHKTRKDTRIKFYKTMAVPILTYGSESWIMNARNKSNIQAAEMRFLRSVKGCTRTDRLRNVEIREELEIFNVNDKIEEYRHNWRQHITRMKEERIPKIILNYHPRGRRDVGRPKKRWS